MNTKPMAPPRSWLFVPGDRAIEMLPKALASQADAVIIDLEDSVPSAGKARARDQMERALTETSHVVPVFVRINSPASSLAAGDVAAAVSAGADGLVIPKASPGHVSIVDQLLASSATLARASTLPVVPLIESAAGVLAAAAVATAGRRVIALGLGGEDLAADLGVSRTPLGLELLYSRGALVLAAAAAGVWAVDTPSLVTDGPDAVAHEAMSARQLGFVGKFAIHPSQVRAINSAFSPTPAEIDAARDVVIQYGAILEADGLGVTVVGGRLVDRPIARAALGVLARVGLLDDIPLSTLRELDP
jgi:citrate lyase subunit beta/citryl-CoA lyase